MRSHRGGFFVLEGLDGSGTTTQTRLLDQHLGGQGVTTSSTREPTDHPIGKLIRDALSGKLVLPDRVEKIALSEGALCLLFAADRTEHSMEIEAIRERNTHVICDRYVLSSIAYQSIDPAITPDRVIDVNRGISIPDVTLLLDVPVDECLRRLEQRNDSPTVYERRETLERIAENYAATIPVYEKHFGLVVRINGAAPPRAVHAEILEAVTPYI